MTVTTEGALVIAKVAELLLPVWLPSPSQLALAPLYEPALAQAVGDGLADAGFVVDLASDGEQALARTGARTYDLIVCDLKMPRVDGMQFYRTIAATKPALARRVIFVTGDVVGTDAERFLEETGCRWLAKPFRLADLLGAARDVLGG